MTPPERSTVTDIVSQPSPFSVDETLRRLERVIGGRGLAIFARFDHTAEAAKAGLTMQPAQVLVFGNPRAGTPLMVASPLIALELPLKTLVWQDDTGQVWVCYAEPSSVARRYGIAPALQKILEAVEGLVQAALGGVDAAPASAVAPAGQG